MNVSPSEDIMDSRDVIERLGELAAQWQDHANGGDSEPLTEDEREELEALTKFAEQGEDNVSDWTYGETLIRDSYFTEYAEQLADDIGAIDKDAKWPLNHIDWEAAADELAADYVELDFSGVTYLARS